MQNTRTSLNRETANAKSNKLDKSSNRQPLQEIQNIPSRLNEIRMFSLNTNENDLLKNQNTKEENYEENPCTPPLYTPKTENSKSESADSNSISKQYEKSKLVYEDYLRDLNKANDLDNHLNKSFSKFGLQRKSDIDNFCYSKRVTHEFLPVSLKNNSNYKKKLIKFIRRSELNEFKTDSNRQLDYFKNSYKFNGNLNKLGSLYKLKRRKVHSVQRCYENEHGLYDPQSGEINFFMIFNDSQVGFTNKWQSQIKQTDMDDDVETDEDQLYAAMRHVKNELRDGNYHWNKKGSKTIRNMYRYSNLVKRPQIEKDIKV